MIYVFFLNEKDTYMKNIRVLQSFEFGLNVIHLYILFLEILIIFLDISKKYLIYQFIIIWVKIRHLYIKMLNNKEFH